jgi:hypothetical protein
MKGLSSGAEGTIIGEPSSLPRMIWGLDPNDAVPNSHVPPSQTQQSRAVSIKPPANSFKARYSAHQGSASSVSTPATFGSLHVGPRFGNAVNYSSFEQVQAGREFSRSMPTALEARREHDHRSNLHRLSRGGPELGLNASVHEEPMRLEHRYEHNLHGDSIVDCSHLTLGTPHTMDRVFELLPVEEIPADQHPSDSGSQDGIHRQHPYRPGSRNGHPTNLFDLLSSPVPLRDHASNVYPRVAPGARTRSIAQEFTPSYLPTPPSSTSPQWSSAFSPLGGGRSLSTGSSRPGSTCDLSSDVAMKPQAHTTNDQLSEELRRFVFENMSPVSSANAIEALQAARLGTRHTSAARSMFLTSHNTLSSFESPAHPPGLPIPQHILLSKTTLEPFGLLSAQEFSPKSGSPSASPYTRSTLSNPRSIPLSRLRQRRGAINLATVPEEDSAEPYVHDGKLAPPSHPPLRLFLRTPSPSDDGLHAQSMEDKTMYGDDSKLGHARVKLPYSASARMGSTQNAYFTSQNTTPQNSPKKKRLQRRKRPVRPMEPEKPGFPLVSEGTVSFGSSDSSATQDMVKEERLSFPK